MSSVQSLREFISQRLTAAAAEIFSEFEKTIVQYEEEINRQRRLLDVTWSPEINLKTTDVLQHHGCEEVAAFSEQNSSLDQEEPEPLRIKEELEELCTSWEGEQLVLKQESDDEPHGGEAELNCRSCCRTESQREVNRNAELKPKTSISDDASETRCGTETPGKSFRRHVCGRAFKENHLSNRHQTVHAELPPDLLQTKEEQEELCTNQEGEQPALKDDNDAFIVTYLHEESDYSEREANGVQFVFRSPATADGRDKDASDDGKSSITCDVCGKAFKYMCLMKQHYRSHTGEKPYICNTCGKCFHKSSQLCSHRRIHTGEKPYVCSTCGKGFAESSTLKKHTVIHTGERPFSCEMCGKSFTLGSNLNVHMRTHLNVMPYLCTTCGKRFAYNAALKIHQRTHTGEKPFSCETCGKNFKHSSSLTIHMRTHTGEKPYCCVTCGKSFVGSGRLMAHMKTHRS